MRASLHPRAAISTFSTWPTTGASTQAASSMSLRDLFRSRISPSNLKSSNAGWAPKPKFSPRFKPMRAKTSRVAKATPGLTSTAKSGGKFSAGPRSSPVPRIILARGSRQTGTSAPMLRAAAITRASSGAILFLAASSRKAAAASEEPPPMPAATGNRLSR